MERVLRSRYINQSINPLEEQGGPGHARLRLHVHAWQCLFKVHRPRYPADQLTRVILSMCVCLS